MKMGMRVQRQHEDVDEGSDSLEHEDGDGVTVTTEIKMRVQ